MKILIIKLGHLGDVLRTTCILQGLKEKYKGVKITWLTKPNARELIAGDEFIDHIYTYTPENIQKLQQQTFDIIYNLDEEDEACSVAKNTKGKVIGFYFDENNQVKATPTMQEWYNMSALGEKPRNDELKKNNTKTYQQILCEIVGIQPRHKDIFIKLTNYQKGVARAFREKHGIGKHEKVVALNTGAGETWQTKRWSVAHTVALADKIHKELGAKLLLFGGPDEDARNKQILEQAKAPIIDAGCHNSLTDFIGLVSVCDLLITSDSLAMHIGIALKRKIIVLFGPTSYHEIDVYNLGVKMIPPTFCDCFYMKECPQKKHSIDYITTDSVFKEVQQLLKRDVTIIITSFKEPEVNKAIDAALHQELDVVPQIIVSAPDEETKRIVEQYQQQHRNLHFFQDPGKGKSYALNMLFKQLKGDILIFTDGDVVLDKHAAQRMIEQFDNPQVGCVCGRVVSSSPKNTMLGYWSHLLADAGAHKIRKEAVQTEQFLECSGYLFAFRNNIIDEIPLDVAEDTYIPYLFWEKGYLIGYADEAFVYVKNPTTFNDWVKQRKRTAKAHETLDKYVNVQRTPRVKTFSNEVKKGAVWALQYPKNFKEYYWTTTLFAARAYMWLHVFADTRLKKKHYTDAWERVATAR